MVKVYPITPMGKPRMTASDKWKKRPCVVRYREFKDEVRRHRVTLEDSCCHIVFVLPMPQSWSGKRKAENFFSPHKSRPDKDNLEKALFDALFSEDSHIWDGRASKVWGYEGSILIGDMGDFEVSVSGDSTKLRIVSNGE